jgi:DNA polymerase-3 subunit alpha
MPALFGAEQKAIEIPRFEVFEDETFYDELQMLGFSVSLSPFSLLQTGFRGEVQAKDLLSYLGQTVKMVGLYVTAKPTLTKNKEAMAFGTFLDVNGDFFDTVHFPKVYQAYPFYKAGLYLIQGKVTESFGFPSIMVEKMAKLPIRPDPRFQLLPRHGAG